MATCGFFRIGEKMDALSPNEITLFQLSIHPLPLHQQTPLPLCHGMFYSIFKAFDGLFDVLKKLAPMETYI